MNDLNRGDHFEKKEVGGIDVHNMTLHLKNVLLNVFCIFYYTVVRYDNLVINDVAEICHPHSKKWETKKIKEKTHIIDSD